MKNRIIKKGMALLAAGALILTPAEGVKTKAAEVFSGGTVRTGRIASIVSLSEEDMRESGEPEPEESESETEEDVDMRGDETGETGAGGENGGSGETELGDGNGGSGETELGGQNGGSGETEPESENGGLAETEPESGEPPESDSGTNDAEEEPGGEGRPSGDSGSQMEQTEDQDETKPPEEQPPSGEKPAESEPENDGETETSAMMEEETERESEEVLLAKGQDAMAAANGAEPADDPVPNKFKLKTWGGASAPASLNRTGSAMTTLKKVTFYEGDTVISRWAYCIQPSAASPGSGETYKKESASELDSDNTKERRMTKALYYLYGGPLWGATVRYSDGSGQVNLKNVMTKAGCTTGEHYYAMTHYVLSYLYIGSSGKWNYNGSSANVLNSSGIALVKTVADHLKALPVPRAELSASSVSSSYDGQKKKSVSESVTYRSFSENTLKITLPGGITLVNETAGTSQTGKAELNGGDRFHLEANPDKVSGKGKYTFQTAYTTDFTALCLKLSGYQDIGFSYYSKEKTLDLTVNWAKAPEPVAGKIRIEKHDALTGTVQPTPGYSMDGAQYTIYRDQACTQAADTVTIKDGQGLSGELSPGLYYIKETTAPAGYQPDPTVYQAAVSDSEAGVEARVVSKDEPKLARIGIQKIDADTKKPEPYTKFLSFEGAKFGIYRDSGCTQLVQELVTDSSGYAQSEPIPMAAYYVKELAPPKGYVLDGTVRAVQAEEMKKAVSGGNGLIKLEIPNRIIRGNARLLKKLLGEDGTAGQEKKELLKGIKFRFTYVKDPSVTFRVTGETDEMNGVIVTDDEGVAATEDREKYPYGTLVYGTWRIEEFDTPPGYRGMEAMEIEVTKDGVTDPYTVENSRIASELQIEKRDLNTGNLIPMAGVKFKIRDSDGNYVKMYDPIQEKETDEFVTGEDGVVRFRDAIGTGTYVLEETDPPSGYQSSEPLTFTVEEGEDQQAKTCIVECMDAPGMGKIEVEKLDEDTQEPCGEGFLFEITAAEDITDLSGSVRKGENADGKETEFVKGTVVGRIATGTDGKALSKELYFGSYLVKEVKAADHYAGSSEEFPVVIDEKTVNAAVQVRAVNKKTRIEIKKVDALDPGAALEGVRFRVFAENEIDGETLEKLKNGSVSGLGEIGREYATGKDGVLHIEDLKHSTKYYVIESGTLPGYHLSPELFEINVDEDGLIDGEAVKELTVENVPNTVQISKTEIAGSEELPGAKLRITDGSGNVVEEWISGSEPHKITGLPAGTYTLTELQAPAGYGVAESITFTVTDSQEIQKVVMEDAKTKVEISKKDITNKEELPGAAMEIRDSEGKLVDQWVSQKEPHKIEGLVPGEYVLTEISAPDGYETAESIRFTITDRMEVQTVIMYDRPEDQPDVPHEKETEPKTEKPEKKIPVHPDGGNPPSGTVSPSTGDETPVGLYLWPGLASLALLLYGAAAGRKRKQKKTDKLS